MPDVTTLDLVWLQFKAPPPNAQVPLILNVLGGQTVLVSTPTLAHCPAHYTALKPSGNAVTATYPSY